MGIATRPTLSIGGTAFTTGFKPNTAEWNSEFDNVYNAVNNIEAANLNSTFYATIPLKAGVETISGNWTFSGVPTFSTMLVTASGSFAALTCDNLLLNGNTLSSTSGNLLVTPVAGSSVILDSHWGFDGTTQTGLTNSDTTFTTYSGRDMILNANYLDINAYVDLDGYGIIHNENGTFKELMSSHIGFENLSLSITLSATSSGSLSAYFSGSSSGYNRTTGGVLTIIGGCGDAGNAGSSSYTYTLIRRVDGSMLSSSTVIGSPNYIGSLIHDITCTDDGFNGLKVGCLFYNDAATSKEFKLQIFSVSRYVSLPG